jgi:hypothetical protein
MRRRSSAVSGGAAAPLEDVGVGGSGGAGVLRSAPA